MPLPPQPTDGTSAVSEHLRMEVEAFWVRRGKPPQSRFRALGERALNHPSHVDPQNEDFRIVLKAAASRNSTSTPRLRPRRDAKNDPSLQKAAQSRPSTSASRHRLQCTTPRHKSESRRRPARLRARGDNSTQPAMQRQNGGESRRRRGWEEESEPKQSISAEATGTNGSDSKPAAAGTEAKGRKGRWDQKPDENALQEEALLMKRMAAMNLPVPRKRKECYVGNLAKGKVTKEVLWDSLRKLFLALPQYQEAYPGTPDPICGIVLPAAGQGQFAFVEFLDEVLAETALLMSGVELCGRPMKIGRPQGYLKSAKEAIPLDVSPLRGVGLVPSFSVFNPDSRPNLQSTRERELYFGNLLAGVVTDEVINDLLLPVCMELPEYEVQQGPPIIKVSMVPHSTFCFVQFQSPEMAASVIEIFNGTELFGKKIRVRRPANMVVDQGSNLLQVAGGQTPGAPPPPPPPSDLTAMLSAKPAMGMLL